jgi:O-antigen/teichoic acid export membrane protein
VEKVNPLAWGREWLWSIRSSTRLAGILHIATRVASSVLSLFWTRLLLQALGTQVFGLLTAFQAFTSLGGLGELGMGWAVGLRVGRGLANRESASLREFLATARTLFVVLGLAMFVAIASLSGVLPYTLGFQATDATGSTVLLFLVGAMSMALVFPTSYIGNLNYACGNLVWGIIPAFLLSQIVFASQVALALAGCPLWLVVLPHVCSSLLLLWFAHWQIRISHPDLSCLFPLRWCWKKIRELGGQSFWVYLGVVSTTVFTATDRLVINKFLGSSFVPSYHLNYKLPEIALFMVGALSFAAGPKLAVWLASSDPAEHKRVTSEVLRLNRFQAFFGIAAAIAYLCFNDAFIRLWLGKEMQISSAIQLAFAATISVTASADAAIQSVGRMGVPGIRFIGSVMGVSGFINLFLSLWAGWAGSLLGVAASTVAAQVFLSLCALHYCSKKLGIAFIPWVFRSVIASLGIMAVMAVAMLGNLPEWTKYAAAVLGLTSSAKVHGISYCAIREEVTHVIRAVKGR